MSQDKITRSPLDELKLAEVRVRLIGAELIAIENKDEVLDIISASENIAKAQSDLETRFNIDHEQSTRIVQMRFGNLSKRRATETREEYNQLLAVIRNLKDDLSKTPKI